LITSHKVYNFQSSVVEDAILLGYDAALMGNWSPMFWRNALCSEYSWKCRSLRIKAVCSFKTLQTYYLVLQCHIPQKWNTHLLQTCIIL